MKWPNTTEQDLLRVRKCFRSPVIGRGLIVLTLLLLPIAIIVGGAVSGIIMLAIETCEDISDVFKVLIGKRGDKV